MAKAPRKSPAPPPTVASRKRLNKKTNKNEKASVKMSPILKIVRSLSYLDINPEKVAAKLFGDRKHDNENSPIVTIMDVDSLLAGMNLKHTPGNFVNIYEDITMWEDIKVDTDFSAFKSKVEKLDQDLESGVDIDGFMAYIEDTN